METKKIENVVKKGKPKRPNFEIKFIKSVIKEIEEGGLSRREVREKYDLRATTVQDWVMRFGSPSYDHPTRHIYKPSEKRTMLRAFKSGMTKKEVSVAFSVNINSLDNWIKADNKGNGDISATNSIVMPKKANHAENYEVKTLKAALKEADLKIKALDTLIDVAEEQLKINIRKKSGAKQS